MGSMNRRFLKTLAERRCSGVVFDLVKGFTRELPVKWESPIKNGMTGAHMWGGDGCEPYKSGQYSEF